MLPVKRRPPPARESHAGADPFMDTLPTWLRAVSGAVGALFGSTVAVCLLVVLAWLTSPQGSGSGTQAVQLGLNTWLLSHGVGLDGPGGGRLSLVPWLLALIPVAFLIWAAQWVVMALEDSPTPPRWGPVGGLRQDVALSVAVFAGSYGLVALLVRVFCTPVGFVASLGGSFFLPALWAMVAYLIALRWEFRDELTQVAPRVAPLWRDRVPLWARRALAPAAWGVGVLLLAGLVVVLLAVLIRWGRVWDLHTELATGFLGGSVLVVAQGLYLPTTALWATSWLAGPGFGVGADSTVTWGNSEPGLLPLVPVLGAIPDRGPLPSWTMSVVLVPVGIGALIALRALQRVSRLASWPAKVQTAGIAVALTGLVMTVLAVLASGSLGSGRLAQVGVNPWLFGLCLTGELALGAAIVVGIRILHVRGGGR